jgi:tRNA A37 threonylcarbamoyladenosine dehydratase
VGIQGVFSRESVAPPDASCALEGDGSLNCHGYGSVVSVTATFGMCAASEILNFLASQPKKAKK